MDAKTEVKAINAMKEEYDKAIKERGQKALKQAFKDFFAANPEVKAVVWTQYTPYFNDGEPCYFSVHDPSFSRLPPDETEIGCYGETDFEGAIDGSDHDYVEDTEAGPDKYGYKQYKKVARTPDPLAPICDDFWEEVFNEDLFLAAFGDHMQITATPDGFEVEDYSHD